MNWYTRKLSCWRCWNQRIALAKKQWVNSWALCLGELIQKKWEHVQLWAVSKRFCSSEGAKGMLARQLTRCLRARSFSLRAGIAYADAYAGLRTPGFCLREVRIATLLLEMKQGVLDVAHMDRKRPPLYLNTFASCCVRYEYHHWALAVQAHGYSMRDIWVPWPPSPADCHA